MKITPEERFLNRHIPVCINSNKVKRAEKFSALFCNKNPIFRHYCFEGSDFSVKKIIAMILVLIFVLSACGEKDNNMLYDEPVERKPVIYLYPEEETEVFVNLDFSGKLTSTYPEYNGGWKVIAKPDGTLFDENGKEYYCLFWEGISEAEYDFEKGFCVPGEKTAEFLEENLPKLGLSPKEANEFIIYWLPQMQENEYNLISFQSEAYTETAKIEIVPKPDTLIRVFMAWKPLDEFVEIEPQELSSPKREGFVAAEWGGAKIG